MTRTILDTLVDAKRAELERVTRERPPHIVQQEAAAAPPLRDFHSAVTAAGSSPRLIGEIKKASPSAGMIRAAFDPADLARRYESSGAGALSILTESAHFQGSLDHLQAARGATDLPVLRKDFLFEPYQVYESRAAGADAILLIAEVLGDTGRLRDLADLARSLGMAVLLEVHDQAQLLRVLPFVTAHSAQSASPESGPDTCRGVVLGINNRDLRTQTIDLDTTRRLAAVLPPGTPFISESGITTPDEVRRLHRLGATALLIGETIMRSPDIAARVSELFQSSAPNSPSRSPEPKRDDGR